MSIKTTFAAAALASIALASVTLASLELAALALGFVVALPSSEAKADVHCSIPPGGTQPLCINSPSGGVVVGGAQSGAPHCYYLPTVSNGRVTGVHQVCN